MKVSNKDTGRRVMYTDRKGNISYGTVRAVTNSFVDIAREGMTQRTFFVPEDSLIFVDADGVPLLGS